MIPRRCSLLVPFAGLSLCFSSFAAADDAFKAMQDGVMEKVSALELDGLTKESALSKKYTEALDVLERKLTAEGNLDLILRVREERAAVAKEGRTTPSKDKPITDLREKYLTAQAAIRAGVEVERTKLVESVRKSVKEQEVALTKAGKVDEAMALRQDTERLVAEIRDLSANFKGAPAGDGQVTEMDAVGNAKTMEAARGRVFRFIFASHPEISLAGQKDKPLRTETKGDGIRVIAGLADPTLVSFELEADKGSYLRHINYKLRCERMPVKDEALFRKDTTFRMLSATDGTVRFQALNFPTYFINLADDGSITIKPNPHPGRCRFRLEPAG